VSESAGMSTNIESSPFPATGVKVEPCHSDSYSSLAAGDVCNIDACFFTTNDWDKRPTSA